MTQKITTFDSIDALQSALGNYNYIADRGLSTTIYLGLILKRPVFLEGAAGVGKTEVAKVLSHILDTELIRLQCYEGLDVHHAIYEWNYPRQMLSIRLSETRQEKLSEADLFSNEFLLRRPLLQAIDSDNEKPPVLLIDEIDRSDTEFEAFLLEILSDFQVTIPEIGTIKTDIPPVVIITSNRTREVHDALKRRCLYHWIEYPNFEKELEIVQARIPTASKKLSVQVTGFIQELRKADLYKIPGVSETLDWLNALISLDHQKLSPEIINDTLGVMIKYQEDLEKIQGDIVNKIFEHISSSA